MMDGVFPTPENALDNLLRAFQEEQNVDVLPSLEEFVFISTQAISEDSATRLAATLQTRYFSHLTHLTLVGVTDDFIEMLIFLAPRLQGLRHLDLRANPLADAIIAKLKDALPRCEITHDSEPSEKPGS
jgi:hypothetical protein